MLKIKCRLKTWFYKVLVSLAERVSIRTVVGGDKVYLKRKVTGDAVCESQFWFRMSKYTYATTGKFSQWSWSIVVYEVKRCERTIRLFEDNALYYGLTVQEFSTLVVSDFPYIADLKYDGTP